MWDFYVQQLINELSAYYLPSIKSPHETFNSESLASLLQESQPLSFAVRVDGNYDISKGDTSLNFSIIIVL